MQKTIFFTFLFLIISWSTQAQSKKKYPLITIQSSNISVGNVLKEITDQTGLDFSYNPQFIDIEKVISFSVRRAKLEKTLDILCEKIGAEFSLVDGQIILFQPSISQTKKFHTLSGFITDESSGESLIGATVAIKGTSQGVATNEFGFYSLEIKPDDYQFQYSYLGYEPKNLDVKIEKDEQKNIAIKPFSVELPDVEVGISLQNKLSEKNADQLELTPNELNKMPEFGGESGLVKGLQSLPGIKMHSDGSSFFYVRGGERDQNVVIIDDAPIYNPSHMFGFYSIVTPDFTKSIKIYKSDVPANLGDRLSSIVSIRTKDGNLNKMEINGAFNPLVNRISLETPVVKNKGSVFVAFRRSNFDWLYKGRAPNSDLNFRDFTFKWNHKVSDKSRVFFTTFFSADKLSNRNPDTNVNNVLQWGNFASTFRWNYIFSPKLFSNTTIYTGNFGSSISFAPNSWQSSLGSLSLKTDLTHFASSKITSKFGYELHNYFINPGSATLDTTISILPDIQPNFNGKSVLYYQGKFQLNNKLKLNAGLRLINWSSRGPTTYYGFNENFEVNDTIQAGKETFNNYLNLDPRLSLQYQLNNSSHFKLSYGNYHQYLQLISNSISPFTAMEIWLPASPNIRPQFSSQVSLSYLKYFEKEKIEFSAASYFKRSKHQIDYEDHAVTLVNPFVEGELRFGKLWSYGIELFLKKETGRFNGWASYTFSRTFRKTDDLNNGSIYRAFQDRPHDFSLMLNYRMKRRMFCSAYFTAYSGSTFSSPTGFYSFQDKTVPVFGEKNNDRLPNYQRLDLALKFILNKKETSQIKHSLTFSIYNFLAHKNVYAVNFNKIPNGNTNPLVKANFLSESSLTASQVDLIRFLPSLTYKIKI